MRISTLLFILLLLLMTVPIFGHLDHVPLQLWDESRLAISALEMSLHGNWLIPTYNDLPDMWSVKPPFMIWMQVVCLKTIGYNEIAIRLPSAIAAALTCIMMYRFIVRKIQAHWLAFCAVMVLITTSGYVTIHSIRSGDYDALLAFFTFAYCISFYQYLEEGHKNQLYWTFALVMLAVMTKSIAGLLFIPGLIIYALYKNQLVPILKSKHFYLGMLILVSVIGAYYLLREHYNPGYLTAVYNNELGGRFNTVTEQHGGDGYFYINNLSDYGFSYWHLLLPLGVITGWLSNDKRIKQLTVFSTLLFVSHIIILSSSATKIDWYAVPDYPFMAIVVAIFIDTIFRMLAAMPYWKEAMSKNILPYFLLIGVFYLPYTKVIDSVMVPPKFSGADDSDYMAYVLKQALHGQRTIDGCTLVWDTYQSNLDWYYKVFKTQGMPVVFKKSDELSGSEKVIAYKQETKQSIIDKFATTKLDSFQNVTIYQLNGIRK